MHCSAIIYIYIDKAGRNLDPGSLLLQTATPMVPARYKAILKCPACQAAGHGLPAQKQHVDLGNLVNFSGDVVNESSVFDCAVR